MDPLTALGTGIVAGLAIAMPLGAIAVLLLQEGAARGWMQGAPAAVGVATVDTLYCLTAALAGAVIAPVIAAWGIWPKITGGAALILLAVRGLVQLRRTRAASTASTVEGGRDSGWRRYALFFALTAINPATLIYFAAVVTGLDGVAASPASVVLFTLGVGGASLAWQSLLVAVGAVLHGRGGRRSRAITTVIGNGVVAALGLAMIAGAVG